MIGVCLCRCLVTRVRLIRGQARLRMVCACVVFVAPGVMSPVHMSWVLLCRCVLWLVVGWALPRVNPTPRRPYSCKKAHAPPGMARRVGDLPQRAATVNGSSFVQHGKLDVVVCHHLMALTALSPTVFPGPEPAGGKAAPGFLYAPKI